MQLPRRACAWIFWLFLLAPWCAGAQTGGPPPAASRSEAGKITLVTGAVSITAPDRSRRTPKLNDTLYEGDTVITGADGELQAEMLDSGVIAVRSNTQMGITKYAAQGDANDTSIFSLVKGSFRSITGWIGKNNPSRYAINTPTATIGVRGTDHEPTVIPEGSKDGEPGTYDKVSAGGSFIQGKAGRVDVTPGRAGFFSVRGNERPRLLDRVPTFFRPSRNEARLEGLHDRLRPQLEQRRTQRQAFVRTQRAQGLSPNGQRLQNNNRGAQQLGPRGQALGNGAQNRQDLRQERLNQRQELHQNGQQGNNRQNLLQARQNENRAALQGRQNEIRQQALQNRQQQAQNRVQERQQHQAAPPQRPAQNRNAHEEKKKHQ
ncbi:MAG TPA: FecR family protein [Burkholderiales bacterium]|jgi:hypothetical protein|nr:FecR family protein [Burkholderiales bacterium]